MYCRRMSNSAAGREVVVVAVFLPIRLEPKASGKHKTNPRPVVLKM
jgi:hypothetical protein